MHIKVEADYLISTLQSLQMSEKKQRKVKAQVPVPGEALRSCGSLQPCPVVVTHSPGLGLGSATPAPPRAKTPPGSSEALILVGNVMGTWPRVGPEGDRDIT